MSSSRSRACSALRDFGLMIGALALTRLAWRYDPPLGSAGG